MEAGREIEREGGRGGGGVSAGPEDAGRRPVGGGAMVQCPTGGRGEGAVCGPLYILPRDIARPF